MMVVVVVLVVGKKQERMEKEAKKGRSSWAGVDSPWYGGMAHSRTSVQQSVKRPVARQLRLWVCGAATYFAIQGQRSGRGREFCGWWWLVTRACFSHSAHSVEAKRWAEDAAEAELEAQPVV